MEQIRYHQWLLQEGEEEQEVQDVIALKGRKSLVGVGLTIPPSSFSPHSNGCSGHCNGVCLASVDEPLLQKEEEVEEMVNGVENGNHIDDNHEAVGFGVIAELVEAATNGETIDSATNNVEFQNMNNVYFDKQQGMWKCHHCSWTKRFDSPCNNVPLGNLGGFSDLLMNVKLKNMIQHGPCFVYETKGIEFNGITKISHLQNTSEVQATTVENSGDISSSETAPNLVKEIEQQLEEELDVEAVLAKQETHDLFCPKCNSCITKRVILKKRKRNTKAKGDKLDKKQDDHAIANSDVGIIEPPPAENQEPEREPEEVFRCLSCFSFFIPLGNGFKLFPTFGGAREPETAQNPSIITPASNVENPSIVAASKENWFFSLFASNDRKKTRGQVDSSVENPRSGSSDHHHSSSTTTTNVLTSSQIGKPEGQISDPAISKNTQPTPDTNSSVKKSITVGSHMENSTGSSVLPEEEPLDDQRFINSPIQDGLSPIQLPRQNSNDVMREEQKIGMDIPAKEEPMNDDVVNEEQKIGRDFMDIPEKEEPVNDDVVNAEKEIGRNFMDIPEKEEPMNDDVMNEERKNRMDFMDIPVKEEPMNDDLRIEEGEKEKDPVDMTQIGLQEAESPAESLGSEVFSNDPTSDKVGSVVDATIPSDQDSVEVEKDIGEEIEDSVTKGKQEGSKSPTSQTEDDVQDKGATATEAHTQIDIEEEPRSETDESQQWEIVKSIVYGGLIESITSLGIVSSAASAGAAPLNIIALGLANLIGGLFIIGHDLIELKNDSSEDRYQELLGRRGNFLLHAVVAVLSFLMFGSVPLVIYGLLIRESFSAEVTILLVAATSIVCIILLAIGKAHTKTAPKPYIKTVSKYVIMALATSGVSYIAGDIVKGLLDKFTGQDSSLVLNMPFSRTMEPALMSY